MFVLNAFSIRFFFSKLKYLLINVRTVYFMIWKYLFDTLLLKVIIIIDLWNVEKFEYNFKWEV